MEKIILTLSKHYLFGWKLFIHWAKEFENGSVEILGTPKAKEEAQKGLSESNLKIIRLAEEVSDTSLMRAFSKHKNVLDFLKELSPETIHRIRTRIEINIRKVINFALQDAVSVYLREDISGKIVYAHSLLHILPAPSQCVFNFVKDGKGLRYFISMTDGYSDISLKTKPVCVLSHDPCLILLGKMIHRVENIDSKKLTPFFEKEYILVPAASEKMYIETFILKTIPKYEVNISGIEMAEITPHRSALLTLEEDFYHQLTFSLFFIYNHHKINPASRKTKYVELAKEKETICWFERDLVWEKRLVTILFDLGLSQSGENRFMMTHEADSFHRFGLINWLNENRINLLDFIIEQQVKLVYYMGSISLLSKIETKIDWFDLNIEVVLDHITLPLSCFRKHILNGVDEYLLPNNTIFVLPQEWFQRYQTLFLHGRETEKGVRLSKMHLGLLNHSVKEIPNIRPLLSCVVSADLRPYQKEGFIWLAHLYNNSLGGCLADDMGLGKTLQTIALLNSIYVQSEKKEITSLYEDQRSLFSLWESTMPASLVVAPKSLLFNWKNELSKFAPELKVYIYAGSNRIKTKEIEKIFNRYHVIITSYSMVRNDLEYLCTYPFHYIILDESQTIKNPDSMVFQSVKKLNSAYKLILTGTPIENSLVDLWAQFDFINPGLLGSSSFFKNNYVQKIKEKNKYAQETLHRLIQPLFLRRTKEEVVFDLPPLLQEYVYCNLTESQQEVYEEEKNRIRNFVLDNREDFAKNSFIALQGLLRLRLIANHPALLEADSQSDSGKFDQIMLYYESIKASGHKVLVFSSFVKHLNLLSKRFEQEGWEYAKLTGQTIDREAQIDRFNGDDNVNCFFISLKAGGVGLNLTAADYVFIIDPWWNPAAEMQALSRSHRIGQKKNVIVYRFISSETIEEKIIRLQQSKMLLSETFITSNNPLKHLNIKEIEDLFL